MIHIAYIFFHGLFGLTLLAYGAWSTTAIWLNLSGVPRILALGLLFGLVLATLAARIYKRSWGWLGFVLSAVVVTGWYQTIQPRADREWATDVSRGVKALVDGSHVTLTNLRDFKWQSEDSATERWITQDFDLDQLDSVEMLTSVWSNPDIAHLLVSFGFADGKRVVFSVEIRREKGEKFSEIGGFFRQFELVLIGATERDIVKLRTDYRGEEVRMFPVNLTPDQRRALFMSYVGLAQELERKPRFYNTISANCTTVVYGLARNLKSDLPLRKSLILSGRLPQYLDGLGVLGGDGTLQERHNAALLPGPAERETSDLPYSQAIRAR
ncbi:protein of unknown function [Epibacterium ulvae]|uniref:Lnb N-terminal periplasmic domain-containing protein n=1 Tax=Epibacterium ulvae TaxID=1156985 RepID=A0A1G5R3F9_9RHOB|nr:DUF4105 domain-containing protein [Epibacterium ulvae]SCZ68537.1 protein of unknown function [Epibacterium ulvae]